MSSSNSTAQLQHNFSHPMRRPELSDILSLLNQKLFWSINSVVWAWLFSNCNFTATQIQWVIHPRNSRVILSYSPSLLNTGYPRPWKLWIWWQIRCWRRVRESPNSNIFYVVFLLCIPPSPSSLLGSSNMTADSQLSLAMSMNRCDLAAQEIFSDENKGTWQVRSKLIITAFILWRKSARQQLLSNIAQ